MMGDRVKRPAFQWYPGDWRRDLGVQACSFEARALWREMLDLMHDGEPYGHLTAGGVPIAMADLARLVGKTVKVVEKWIHELESRKVFSRTAAGVIYSRRMVRDEDVRNKRAKGGPKSLENENVPRPKDPSKDGDKDTFDPSLPGSNGGSPAVAVAVASAVASAKEPLLLEYARAITIRANQGLAEHPTRPQAIDPIVATSGSSHESAEQLVAAGVPLAFAEAHIYQHARSHKADGKVVSLKFFVERTKGAWEKAKASADANGAERLTVNGNGSHAPDSGDAAIEEGVRRAFAKREATHA